MPNYFNSDVIYALATPAVSSSIAVYRVSGKDCISLFNLYLDKPINLKRNKDLFFRRIIFESQLVDEVVIIAYKEGCGYTREEGLEISIHGSLAVMQTVEKVLKCAGFRLAYRGEFTFRAVRNGTLSINQAEAVKELIDSNTETMMKNALAALSGRIDDAFKIIDEKLLDLLSVFELPLDYSDEDLDENWTYPFELISDLRTELVKLISTYSYTQKIENGIKVAIIGETNTGKSTLFNKLLNENRSIVSDRKGTTRDYISECVEIGGVKVILFDTAGLNEDAHDIEKEGIERTLNIERGADIILYLLSFGDSVRSGDKYINIINKIDLQKKKIKADNCICISAKTGEGMNDLLEKIKEKLMSFTRPSESTSAIIISKREEEHLQNILNYINEIKTDMPLEIQASIVNNALAEMRELRGLEIESDEVLNRIFSLFCVGK